MNIFLVRHAQSESNVDLNVLKNKSNVKVKLTDTGILQAKETANALSDLISKNEDLIVWNSPYQRTRLTADIIKEQFSNKNIDFKEIESIYLSERQFGILDDTVDYESKHPSEFNHYKINQTDGTHFFARPPLGESPFDMCLRLDFFIKQILQNRKEQNHVIVSHGAAIKGFITMIENLSYEEYTDMRNVPNASISHISNDDYKGVIFIPSNHTY